MGAAVTTLLSPGPIPPALPSILSTESEGLKKCMLGGRGLGVYVTRLWIRGDKVRRMLFCNYN